jgi:hypothetical protein
VEEEHMTYQVDEKPDQSKKPQPPADDAFAVAREHVRRAAAEVGAALALFERGEPGEAFLRLERAGPTFEVLAETANTNRRIRCGLWRHPWRAEHLHPPVEALRGHVNYLVGLLTAATAATARGVDLLPAEDCSPVQGTLDLVAEMLHRATLHLRAVVDRPPPAAPESSAEGSGKLPESSHPGRPTETGGSLSMQQRRGIA